jgi:hypothetical protein
MSRADTPIEKRQSFHLYVDEFQSFATSSFNEILSESRKYGLQLTIAHQYLDQLPADVRAAVLGNVANILSFRVGAEDAEVLASEFQPRFSAQDIASLPMRDFYTKLSIRGQAYEAFSGRTLDLVAPEPNFKQNCIEHSRSRFAVAKEHAHTMLQQWEKSL